MPVRLMIVVILWAAWALPFFVRRTRGPRQEAVIKRCSRVGVLLQGAGYAVLWAFARFRGEVDWWRAVPGILFGLLAVALVWQAIPALGKQWRVQAGLNQDHQLIRTGPYAIVRHPIYASMLGMFLMTGLLLTPWLPLLAALLVFLLGTEIRVRIEDQLLAGRFGAEFEEYRRRVSAYLPGVR